MLNVLHWCILVLLLAAVIYFVVMFLADYAQETGSPFARAIAATRNSATVLWARFVALIGAIVYALSSFSDLLGSSALSDAIHAYLQPTYVAAAMFGIAVITELARSRSLKS